MVLRTRSRVKGIYSGSFLFPLKTHFTQQDNETAADLVLAIDHAHASPTYSIKYSLECCRLTRYLILIFFVIINFFVLGRLLYKKCLLSQFNGNYIWVDVTIETAY